MIEQPERGRRLYCSQACAARYYRWERPDAHREVLQRSKLRHREKRIAETRAWREKNRERLFAERPIAAARTRAWSKQNREPIDPDLCWPDPMSVSLDHVVPIYEGGPDASSNVRATHLTCNVRRPRKKR